MMALIIFIGLFSSLIPDSLQSILYAISLSIKSFIVFCLPLIIFGLLFRTAVNFAKKASKIILFLLGGVCCSNFVSTMISYFIGTAAYQFDLSMPFPQEGAALLPAWDFSLPKWIANDMAMFAGLLSGVVLGWMKPSSAHLLASKLEVVVNKFLKIILAVIPLFITGFVVKMSHDKVLGYIFSNYALIFILIASALLAYVFILYLVANRFNPAAAFKSMGNMLPAAITGLGSMSSAAAMPLTILGTEKNSKNPDLARSIIPATVNIHLIGDCFSIPVLAFAVMKSFGVPEPLLISYLIFALYFVLAKFSVAAVPGGGILVMLPILETHLGFNAEMLSLITALYILFDPIITCANILGNGGFAMIIDRLWKRAPDNSVAMEQKKAFG